MLRRTPLRRFPRPWPLARLARFAWPAVVGTSAGAWACGSRTGLDEALRAEKTFGPDAQAGVDAPRVSPPLDCAEAGTTYIYVIAEDNALYSFYPTTGEFTLVGVIDCPAPQGAEPFSMAVDHKGVAYVVFSNSTSGGGDGALFRVSTKTASCEATAYAPGQHGFTTFGMGFVANDASQTDAGAGETLYVAGDGNNALATINVDTFVLTEVAPIGNAGEAIAVNMAELTGTGDGRLFGFFAPDNATAPSYIIQIDPRTASILKTVELPGVAEGDGWAFGFYGGDFFTFTAPADTTIVTRYRPSDLSVTQVASLPGVLIVGAGVSTCAPQE